MILKLKHKEEWWLYSDIKDVRYEIMDDIEEVEEFINGKRKNIIYFVDKILDLIDEYDEDEKKNGFNGTFNGRISIIKFSDLKGLSTVIINPEINVFLLNDEGETIERIN